MDDTGIPTNVSYSQHGFSQPPMINTGGGPGGGGMGPMSSPSGVSGPTSPGMSSGGIPSPHSSGGGPQNPPVQNPQSPYSSVADTPPPAYTAQDNIGGMTPQQQMQQPPHMQDQSQVGDGWCSYLGWNLTSKGVQLWPADTSGQFCC